MTVLGVMLSVIVSATDAPVQIENCEYSSSFLTCDIINQSDTAIRAVHFDVLAKDQNRAVPWYEPDGLQRFGAEIRGGIEPKETLRHLLLIPDMPNRASIETLQLELIGVTAFGPDGEPITN